MTELGAQEITELVEKASELGVQLDLPTTKAGVKKRADSQNWQTHTVKGKGGRSGLKTLYSLPNQVIEELERKGLSHLLKMGNNTSVTVAPTKAAQPIQPSLPVHYHTNVFGSVGNGYEMLESVKTKVMWFRSSFFNLLGAPPARCFCTHVRGESMHPTLIDKGTVMWQMQNSYTIEGIYLFRQVNELRIKRLQRVNSHTYRIISDNKEFYPVETLDLRDMESHKFEIYGKYLWDCAIRP